MLPDVRGATGIVGGEGSAVVRAGVVGAVVGRGDADFFPDVCLGPVAEVFEDCAAAAAFFVDDGDPAAGLFGMTLVTVASCPLVVISTPI